MNRDYAESYEEHKSGKYEYVKGLEDQDVIKVQIIQKIF